MKYSDGFERFWKSFRQSPSPKGSKFEAWGIWKNDGLEQYTDEIIEGITKCLNNDKYFKAKGEFVASWKHCSRWLKNRCWDVEDEAQIERDKKIEARRMQRQKEVEKQYEQSRDWLLENRDRWDELEKNPVYKPLVEMARNET